MGHKLIVSVNCDNHPLMWSALKKIPHTNRVDFKKKKVEHSIRVLFIVYKKWLCVCMLNIISASLDNNNNYYKKKRHKNKHENIKLNHLEFLC